MKNKLKKVQTMGMVMLLFASLGVSSLTAEAKKANEQQEVAKKIVVINPGCQQVENSQKESVGPGAWTRVADDMVGAKGVVTDNKEYDVNLSVAEKTEAALTEMGYQVEMTRTTNDVDMNNVERAMVANTLDADIYISIHASNESKKDSGVSVICETVDNPYNFGEYDSCRLLADTILGSVSESTADTSGTVIEKDDVIGINWCSVPNAIVVVGNINNAEDDEKLNDEEYQKTVAEGIANGVDSYFTQK